VAPTLQELEIPIQEEVVRAVIALTPERWRAAVLMVRCSEEGGIEGCEHVISSPEGHREPVTPSDGLFDAPHAVSETSPRSTGERGARPASRWNSRKTVTGDT
jgi:hypothetical protein